MPVWFGPCSGADEIGLVPLLADYVIRHHYSHLEEGEPRGRLGCEAVRLSYAWYPLRPLGNLYLWYGLIRAGA